MMISVFRPASARVALLAFVLVLAGCTASSVRVSEDGQGRAVEEAPPPKNRYVAEANLHPEDLAALRAAAAPAQTAFQDGKQLNVDEDRLGAQGYVRVGTGYYREPGTLGAPPAAADQAREIGADLALLYPAPNPDGETRVAFFIRMKLQFGATYRDLNQAERDKVGGSGVQLGNIVGGSPASRANLLPGDIVVSVDGAPVTGKAEFQRLLKLKAGKRASLSVVRDGVAVQREVRVGVAAK